MMDINQEKDNEFDKALRPLDFTDFIGQLSIINNLKIFVEASNPVSYTHLTLPTICSV